MKRLIVFLLTLTLAAGCASAASSKQTSQPVVGQKTVAEVKELTEEEFISVLTSIQWTYTDTAKKTTTFMSFHKDGTCTMKTVGTSYKTEWEIIDKNTVSNTLIDEGITYELTYRLVLKDGRYELRDTSRHGVIWIPAEIY